MTLSWNTCRDCILSSYYTEKAAAAENRKCLVAFLIFLLRVHERPSKFVIGDIHSHFGWIKKYKGRVSCLLSMNIVWILSFHAFSCNSLISNFMQQSTACCILNMLKNPVIFSKSHISLSHWRKIQSKSFSFYKSLILVNITVIYLTISHRAEVQQRIFFSWYITHKEVSPTAIYCWVKRQKNRKHSVCYSASVNTKF